MQDEINEKTIALYIKTGKLTAQTLQKAMKTLLAQMKKQKDKTPQGKQTLKQLMKQNAGVSNIEITEGNIKAFESTAKKYGIDFALKKDTTESPPRYLVFFKGRDADVLTAAFKEFSAKKLTQEKKPSIPVIMLTAVDDEYTQSNSFDELADDYITKPFSMLILGKRITALLRRSENKTATNTIQLGTVTVDFAGYTAHDENGKIDITPKEIEILKVLIENKGLVLSRNQILDDVWGYDCDVIDRTIDAYIRNIRKKLHLDCITTVKGIGYKLEVEV